MKAAILIAPGQPLVIEDVMMSKPGPHEVLIRTAACGLCHSDLHFIEPFPVMKRLVLLRPLAAKCVRLRSAMRSYPACRPFAASVSFA
jgi:hypothetical protein